MGQGLEEDCAHLPAGRLSVKKIAALEARKRQSRRFA
jgi:hypothetical protein